MTSGEGGTVLGMRWECAHEHPQDILFMFFAIFAVRPGCRELRSAKMSSAVCETKGTMAGPRGEFIFKLEMIFFCALEFFGEFHCSRLLLRISTFSRVGVVCLVEADSTYLVMYCIQTLTFFRLFLHLQC